VLTAVRRAGAAKILSTDTWIPSQQALALRADAAVDAAFDDMAE
jgi:hypothetical protein